MSGGQALNSDKKGLHILIKFLFHTDAEFLVFYAQICFEIIDMQIYGISGHEIDETFEYRVST